MKPYRCTAPWHRGPHRLSTLDQTGRYPASWCFECALELPYRVDSGDLLRVPPVDRAKVCRWLLHAGWWRTAAALWRVGIKRSLDWIEARDFARARSSDWRELRRLVRSAPPGGFNDSAPTTTVRDTYTAWAKACAVAC